MVLDHIEIFMDMIAKGNYKDASYIAACSPKGVLRNMETLLKFKGNILLKMILNIELNNFYND